MENGKKRILVCITSAYTGKKLIKIASKQASFYHAELLAVYVKERIRRNQDDDSLQSNFEYAKSLHAETEILEGRNAAGTIAQYAKKHHVDVVICGRSRKKGLSDKYFYLKLHRLLPNAEVLMIPQAQPEYDPSYKDNVLKVTWKDIGIICGIMILSTLICYWFHMLGFTDATLITVYILGVLMVSFLTNGYVCSMISSIISVSLFNFLFTVPVFSLQSYGIGYPVTLVVMFLAAFLTSSLTAQVKRQAQQHAQNAYRTEMLLNANRRMELASGENAIMKEAADQIQKLLLRSVMIYPVVDGVLEKPLYAAAGENEKQLAQEASSDKEKTAAEWVVENNTQAGAGTGIFDDSLFWYLAVRLNDGSICAVTAIRVDRDESIDDFDKNLLLAMLAECSVVIEKERLNHKNAEYAFRMKQEHLRSNLLRSISHDLRTPLTTISGNASLLIEGTVKDEVERRRVYQDIYDDSVWLTGLVENLLSITKMDGGTLNMNMQAQDLGDIVDAAVAHAEPRLKQAIISVDKGKEISIVNGDSSLLVQLAVNLIDNAVKYAGENCHIHISLRNSNGQCRLSVADNGKGISDTDKKKIFDMFYTAQKNTTIDGRRGLGLGLSLCKSIAQAHGGTINVADAYPHGAIFTVSLPEMKGNII